jgi:hypothetical protein
MDKILVGYYRSLDQVPSPLAPVLRDTSSKRFFVAFALVDSSGGEAREIGDPHGNPEFTEITDQRIVRGFDYRKHSLYLVACNSVERYEIRKANIFFAKLLEDFNFSEDNPFLRLSIAKSLCDHALVFRELNICNHCVKGKGGGAWSVWSRDYIEELSELASALDKSSKLYFEIDRAKSDAIAETASRNCTGKDFPII